MFWSSDTMHTKSDGLEAIEKQLACVKLHVITATRWWTPNWNQKAIQKFASPSHWPVCRKLTIVRIQEDQPIQRNQQEWVLQGGRFPDKNVRNSFYFFFFFRCIGTRGLYETSNPTRVKASEKMSMASKRNELIFFVIKPVVRRARCYCRVRRWTKSREPVNLRGPWAMHLFE